MHHGIHPGHGLLHDRAVADVAPDQAESRIRPDAKECLAAVRQDVEHDHVMAGAKKHRHEGRTHVSRATGDQYFHDIAPTGSASACARA